MQADARLARPTGAAQRDEPHVVAAQQCARRCDQLVAADERSAEDRRSFGRRIAFNDGTTGATVARRARAFVLGQRELVPASGDGHYRLRPEELAQVHHVNLQVVLLDDQARPDDVEQLLLRHDPVAPLHQRLEQVERAAAELRRPPVDEYDTRMRVDADPTRMERHGTMGCVQGARPPFAAHDSQLCSRRQTAADSYVAMRKPRWLAVPLPRADGPRAIRQVAQRRRWCMTQIKLGFSQLGVLRAGASVASTSIQPISGDRRARHRRAKRLREQLSAQAMAEHRNTAPRPPRARARTPARPTGRASLTLMGPPIIAMPANARGSAGTRAPASSGTRVQAMPRASSHSAKYAGPSVGEKRRTATGRMKAGRTAKRF